MGYCSYYEAKVIGKSGANKFLVEYKNLVTVENEKVLFKEVVSVSRIRPKPPVLIALEFNVLDKVDAFDNDGWWVGRITGRDAHKYNVYFESSGHDILYSLDCLRPHQEYEIGR